MARRDPDRIAFEDVQPNADTTQAARQAGLAGGNNESQTFLGRGPLGVMATVDVEFDAGVNQEYLDVLRAVREQMNLNVRMLGGRAVQYRADEMRTEFGELRHHA